MTSIESPARAQLQRLRTAVGEVMATGAPLAVHRTRVACRRLNELLDLMSVWLDPGLVRRTGRSLKRLRRCFQEVRDLDVLLASLCARPTSERLGPQELARLEGELTRRRERAFDQALEAARLLEPAQVLEDVQRLCDLLEPAVVDERSVLQDRLTEMFRARAAALSACSVSADESTDLHQNRIALKRLRYVAELIHQFELGLNEAWISTLAQAQDVLGSWHDHVVAAERIGKLARRRRVSYTQTAWAAQLLEYAAFRLELAEIDRRQIQARWPELLGSLAAIELPPSPAPVQPNGHEATTRTEAHKQEN